MTDAGEPDAGPPAPIFQPSFHQALRLDVEAPALATVRLVVPVGRGGQRLRVTFLAGDRPLTLERAFVARPGADGALSSPPVPLTFGGQPGTKAEARQLRQSDPVPFEVHAGEEVAVSFEFKGALGASKMAGFPGSWARWGAYADTAGPLGGILHPRAVGLATIDTEDAPARAAVAIGDSITEGYVEGDTTTGTALADGQLQRTDDYRRGWTHQAELAVGFPIDNAGVSGQGLFGALDHLDTEVLALEGITDCVVALGTNDLGVRTREQILDAYARLLERLRPFCRIWVATLPPKERTERGDLATVREDRKAVNAFLRALPDVAGVIDFEAALRSADDPDRFADGLGYDGIHPSEAGQARMAEEAARVLGAAP